MSYVKYPIAIAALMAFGTTAHAQNFDMQITADNGYSLFLGNASGATSQVGSDFNSNATQIFSRENYTFSNAQFIYITSWNVGGPLGMLFDLIDTTNNIDYSSGVGAWEVALLNETGRSSSPHTVAQLNTLLADPLSGPFNPVFVGDNNDTSFSTLRPVGPPPIGGISANAAWIWDDLGSTNPFNAGSRQTVVFRLEIPAPGAALLAGVAGVGALRRRR